MNLTNQMLSKIGEFFPLQVQNPDEVKRMKVSGMTFDISTYRVEGLGHVSGMIASGFFGLMKMDTLSITPMDVDMPLFSYDRVLAMGNDTLIFELYDTLLGEPDMSPVARVKEKYKDLPDHDLGEHWYDSIKLAVSLSINPNTIQRAYRLLEFNGWIVTIPGKGCFVCDNESQIEQEVERWYTAFDEATASLIALGVSREQMVERLKRGGNKDA